MNWHEFKNKHLMTVIGVVLWIAIAIFAIVLAVKNDGDGESSLCADCTVVLRAVD